MCIYFKYQQPAQESSSLLPRGQKCGLCHNVFCAGGGWDRLLYTNTYTYTTIKNIYTTCTNSSTYTSISNSKNINTITKTITNII